jgi:hypothetical protein
MNDKTLKCLSDRLNFALEVTKISKAELARMINVKPQTIQYLCSTSAESSKFTFELAHALGINFEWLAVGKGDIHDAEAQPTEHKDSVKNLPLYTIDTLRDVLKNSLFDRAIHADSFQFELQDQSMWPRFSQGTLLIFSRIIPEKNGSFVLVYLNAIDDIIFREIKELNGKKMLVPFNSSLFKEIDLQESDKILGVLTEARWRIES